MLSLYTLALFVLVAVVFASSDQFLHLLNSNRLLSDLSPIYYVGSNADKLSLIAVIDLFRSIDFSNLVDLSANKTLMTIISLTFGNLLIEE
jgi:hypothetical protein